MSSLADYVFGSAADSRAWWEGNTTDVIVADSLMVQEANQRQLICPKRFAGAFQSARDMLNFMVAFGYGTTAQAGFGTTGYLNGSYAPWLVQELKFNGTAPLGGGGVISLDRILDAVSTITTSRTSSITWGNSWDWLRKRKGVATLFTVGTGNDVANVEGMVRTAAGAALGTSAAVSTGALGTVIGTDFAFDAAAIASSDDVYPTLLFKTATAPAANKLLSVIGFLIRADDTSNRLDPRPSHAYWNMGIASQRLQDFQDATKFSQDGRAKLLQLAGCTDYEIAFGQNEAFFGSIANVAAFRAQLETEIALVRTYLPGLRIRLVTPYIGDESKRTILQYVAQAMIECAEESDHVRCLDIQNYFDDHGGVSALAYLLQGDLTHMTTEGYAARLQVLYQMEQELAAQAADVNVVSWNDTAVTADSIAEEVLDVAGADHDTVGTIGYRINRVLDVQTETTLISGDTGNLLNRLTSDRATKLDNLDAAITTRATPADVSTSLTTAGTTINVNNPTDVDGDTTIVQGDDYTNNGVADRRLTYTFTGFTGTVVGATAEWSLTPMKAYERARAAQPELTVTTGISLTVDGTTLTVKVPVTGDETAALDYVSQTDADAGYKVQLAVIGSGGERVTELLADGVVLKRVGG